MTFSKFNRLPTGGSKQKDIGGPSAQSIPTCIPTIRPAEKFLSIQGPDSIEFSEAKKGEVHAKFLTI